ncbi:hypothetical protein, partial [Mesorhizobium sp. M7A.F.Ca.ET.027.02.1.1]|uniref:hypothetical protein n=1 Tax=Mesorhizobium sp. M7A.F.Ca.ET.027.02.1.1 TaxID=2496655 RepID=UPI00167C3E96
IYKSAEDVSTKLIRAKQIYAVPRREWFPGDQFGFAERSNQVCEKGGEQVNRDDGEAELHVEGRFPEGIPKSTAPA